MAAGDDRVGSDELARLDPAQRVVIEQMIETARAVAGTTFGGAFDDEGSEFAVADGMDAAATWTVLTQRVAVACAHAVAWGLARVPMTLERIEEIHRLIFATTFPAEAGRIRDLGVEVQYGYLLGTRDSPQAAVQRGTSSRRLRRRLDVLCKDFNVDAERQDRLRETHLDALLEIAVRFYAKLLSAHPFVDGNGRTAFVALQYALIRLGLVAVALEDHRAHQWALGCALRTDSRHSYRQLVRLIADKLSEAS